MSTFKTKTVAAAVCAAFLLFAPLAHATPEKAASICSIQQAESCIEIFGFELCAIVTVTVCP
jgi:hypothetical protein